MSEEQSILDLFDPPEDMVGQVAVLCAMTASDDFLLSALERFTGQSGRGRSKLGDLSAYLFLDAGERLRGPLNVPGLYQFSPRPGAEKNLLHAKVALISFGEGRNADTKSLRLIVFTGNWTEASALRQLELVFCIDVDVTDGKVSGDALNRADVAMAAAFMKRVQTRYYDRELAPEIRRPLDRLLALARSVSGRKRGRFVSSLDASLFQQMKQRLGHQDLQRKRNFMLCGSGSFERDVTEGKTPRVLEKLRSLPGLTKKVTSHVVVNSQDCDSIAQWGVSAAEDAGWTINKAGDPLGESTRTLHAKFVFVGYQQSGIMSGGWCYFGSGNLTQPGLMWRASADGNMRGNIEAGVMFSFPEKVDHDSLDQHFPFGDFVEEDSELSAQEKSTEDECEREPVAVSPILWAKLEKKRMSLGWRSDASSDFEIGTSGSMSPVALGEKSVPWLELCQCLLVCDARSGVTWSVPVIDEQGAIARTPVPGPQPFDEALASLFAYVGEAEEMEAVSDDEELDGDDNQLDPPGSVGTASSLGESDYPLYTLHRFFEQMGTIQSQLGLGQQKDWLRYLELFLPGLFEEQVLAGWRNLKVGLGVLLEDGFAPAEMSDEVLRQYTNLMGSVGKKWGLHDT